MTRVEIGEVLPTTSIVDVLGEFQVAIMPGDAALPD